jgi:hypothetical protein
MFALLIGTALLLPPAQAPSPAAMVLSTRGQVTLTRGAGEKQRVGAMDLVRPGDRLSVPAGGQATLVVLHDGHRERVKPSEEVTVERKGCEPAASVERLAAAQGMRGAQLAGLRELAQSSHAGVGVLRGEAPAAPPQVSPMYGAAVLTERSTLSWPAVPGVTGYQVEVLRGNCNRLVWRLEAADNHLAYPSEQPPLRYGARYLWRVTAHESGGKDRLVVSSKLLTVTRTEAKELAHLEPLGRSDDVGDLVLAATTYEAHGVYDRALALYERLAKMDPHNAVFQEALASYYERAGRPADAQVARAQARQLAAE